MSDHSPEAVSEWMQGLGRIAYEAYGEHADWLTYNGRTMPHWLDLTDEVRGHWTASAMTTIAHHVRKVAEDA